MSDQVAVVRSLLTALRQAGAEERAGFFERRFEECDWSVPPDAVGQVMAALQSALADPSPPATEAAASVAGEEWSGPYCLEHFAPFIGAMDNGLALVSAINDMARADDFESLLRATENVFVQRLGFEGRRVDLSRRLTSNGLSRMWAVAEYDDFRVLVVEQREPSPYLTVFQPVFRAYRNSLVVATDSRGTHVRFVFHRTEGDRDARVWGRSLRGYRRYRDPYDNLLVWAWRLHSLRPQRGDSSTDLRTKCEAVLTVSPSDLATSWQSSPVEGVWGPTWRSLPRREADGFLQSEGWFWGLHGVIRERFPIQGIRTDLCVECLDVQIVDDGSNQDVEEVLNARETLCATVRLKLQITVNGDVGIFDLACRVPVPSHEGFFILEGAQYAMCPSVQSGGRLATPLLDAEDEDVVEAYIGAMEEDEESVEDGLTSKRTVEFQGASVAALLEMTLAAKLGFIGLRLARLRADFIETPAAVLGHLARWGDSQGRLIVAAESVLRSWLRPAPEDRRAVADDGNNPLPPSWACLNTSSLHGDQWHVVNAARLHPCGVLAVPVPGDGSGRFAYTQESALEVQAQRPDADWVAADIGYDAGAILLKSGLVVVGGELSVGVRRSALPTRRFRRWVRVDIPMPEGCQRAPRFLYQEGDRVGGDGCWLALDLNTWSHGIDSPRVLDFLQRARERAQNEPARLDLSAKAVSFRLPPDVAGTVLSTVLSPVFSPWGSQVGWRASLEVALEPSAWSAVLPDGRTAWVNPVPDEDMPWHPGGEVADCVVTDPTARVAGGDEIFYQGSDGEVMERCSGSVEVRIVPECGFIGPDLGAQRSLGNGRQLARHPLLRMSATQRLWLAATQPAAAAALARNERAGAGGVPPGWRHLLAALLSARMPIGKDDVPAAWVDLVHGRGPLNARVDWKRADMLKGKAHWHPDEPPHGLRWRCDCGELGGLAAAFERCVACESLVARRLADLSERTLAGLLLSEPCLHPWRKSVAATLMGLTESELNELVGIHGTGEICRLLYRAAGRPEKSAHRRLQSDIPDKVRLELERGLHALRVHLAVFSSEDGLGLVVSELVHLPGALMPAGYSPGAPDLVASPLLAKLRGIRRASRAVKRMRVGCSPGAHRAALAELQATVDDYFGASDGSSPGTLGSLVRRLWLMPDASSAPGVFWSTEAGTQLVVTVQDEEERWNPDVLLIEMPPERGDSRNPEVWKRRWALYNFRKTILPRLLGVAASVDGPVQIGWQRWVGIFRSLDRRSVDLVALVEVLLGRLPLPLPGDPDEARSALVERLRLDRIDPELGGDLLGLLGGWWQVPRETHQLGWIWRHPSEALAVDGARRAIPPVHSSAWGHFSAFNVFTDPLEFASRRSVPLTSGLLGFLAGWDEPGFDIEPDEVDVPVEDAADDLEEHAAEEPPEVGVHDELVDDEPTFETEQIEYDAEITVTDTPVPLPAGDIIVLQVSLADWLSKDERDVRGITRPCSVCDHPPGMHKCCPHCLVSAEGQPAIEAVFGFRNVQTASGRALIPQPWCRSCRIAERQKSGEA